MIAAVSPGLESDATALVNAAANEAASEIVDVAGLVVDTSPSRPGYRVDMRVAIRNNSWAVTGVDPQS